MKCDILIVGCGGTGSHYIKELGRLLYSKSIREKDIQIILVDGDIVEEKNLVRQAFMPRDVGNNKAQVMAQILFEVYEIEASYYEQYIDRADDLKKLVREDSVILLVGCVDNHQCRQSMHQFYQEMENCIYMDSANEYSAGEVIIGSRIGNIEMYPDRCQYFPDILEIEEKRRSEESCEVLNASTPQHLLTNQLAGWILLVYTTKFLSGEWLGGIVFFDAFKCYSMDRTKREEYNGMGRTRADEHLPF